MYKLFLYAALILFPVNVFSQSAVIKTEEDPEIKALKTQFDKISYSNKTSEENAKAKLKELDFEFQKLSLENKLAAEKNKKEIYELTKKLEKLKNENELKNEEIKSASMAYAKEKNDMEMEIKRMELAEKKAKNENEMLKARLEKLKTELELRDKKDDWKKQSNTDPKYYDKPFDEKTKELVLSDRRISLNGPIVKDTADYVTERIHYFNNISTQPIFIVIDNSPGGSVMSGYRILKAMDSSKAPVYVVVKSFAASMAAVITTMAKKSFVYPNAIILHHQMSTMNWGNMTQLKEQLEWAKEWEKRLHTPVAKKMGISMDEFRKRMYEKNSDGDWQEFGDNAVNYKWADYIVDRIEETAFVKNPDYKPIESAKKASYYEEKNDEKGQRYVNLPRLEPFDFYFIYNPDRYYR
ncbi:MAG: ATP-dependent Clp protease proteolytic subunit [Elusimicrobiota bacterium]